MRVAGLPFLLCLIFASGCASQATGNWGANATLQPGWERVAKSARDAALSPHSWLPTLGAALFAIADWDEQTLEWATDHNPLFGNIEDAKQWSDDLAVAASLNWLVTGVAAPSGKEHFWRNKVRGLGGQALTLAATRSITDGMKSLTDRERPDRPDSNNSFPSLHTSGASSAATLASRNIEQLDLSDRSKSAWKFGSYSLAALTGWARIEGNRHYPSDVLFGYALGHFIAAFVNDAFIMPERGNLHFRAEQAGPEGLVVGLDYRW